MNSLGQQKDVEYTEYSVLPLRRSSRCFEDDTAVSHHFWLGTLTEGKGLSTIELFVLTCLDYLFLYCQQYLLFTKQPTLMWRSTVLILPLELVFPDF
jgi:hypothetical protein